MFIPSAETQGWLASRLVPIGLRLKAAKSVCYVPQHLASELTAPVLTSPNRDPVARPTVGTPLLFESMVSHS